MKAFALAFLVSLSLSLTAAEVRPGDSLASVKASLGVPRGQVRVGDRHLLYFDRGEVEFQSGVVSRVALLSAEEYAAIETKRTALAARLREDQEIRRAQLIVEGEKLLARKLSDPAFQAAPAAYQVAFWEDFARRYPDVASSEFLVVARQRNIEQLEARRAREEGAQRLADLEARVRDAEERVSYAETSPIRIRNYYHPVDYSHQPTEPMKFEYHYFDVVHSAAGSPGPFNTPASNRYDNMSLPPRAYEPTRFDRPAPSEFTPRNTERDGGRVSSPFPRRF